MSSTWTRFPGLDGTVKALRLPAPLPLGLLIRRSVPCAPARFVVSLSRSGAGAGLLRAGVLTVRAGRSPSSDACTWTRPSLPGSLAIIPWPCDVLRPRSVRSASPVAAVPVLPPLSGNKKAPALTVSRLSRSLRHPLCTLHMLPCAMQHSLPAGGLRLCRAGVEPAGSRRKVPGHPVLLSRAWPGARRLPLGCPEDSDAGAAALTRRVNGMAASARCLAVGSRPCSRARARDARPKGRDRHPLPAATRSEASMASSAWLPARQGSPVAKRCARTVTTSDLPMPGTLEVVQQVAAETIFKPGLQTFSAESGGWPHQAPSSGKRSGPSRPATHQLAGTAGAGAGHGAWPGNGGPGRPPDHQPCAPGTLGTRRSPEPVISGPAKEFAGIIGTTPLRIGTIESIWDEPSLFYLESLLSLTGTQLIDPD